MKSLGALLSLSLVLLACSSSKPPAGPAAADTAPESSVDASADEEAAAEPEAEEPKPSCDDGTCFECGRGLCPIGAYCDQGAPDGAACVWIQECPGAPSCSCLRKVLGSSCQCEESGGGPRVTCP